MTLLDLDELPEVLDRHPALVGAAPGAGVVPPRGLPRRPGRATRRGGPPPGRGAHRRRPAARCGCSPSLRYLGVGFNPVSFFICLDAAGRSER